MTESKKDNAIFNLKASEKLLLRLIRQYSPSRKELSALSGLTPGAVTQYCRKLLFLGLIKETEKMVKKRGTPSFHLTLNPNACCSIGITFSDNSFQLAIVDFIGNKIANERYVYHNSVQFDELCQQIRTALQQLLDKKFLAEAKILGIGFSLSGYLLADQSISSPWFPLLQNIPNLANVFSEKLGYPCHIENNINTVALGEYYSGLWNDIEDMVVISLDFGIGAGIISQGKLIRGGFGNAGEIGLLFPYSSPRPSWKDLKEKLGEENQQTNLLNNLTVKTWLAHSQLQVLSLILSAIAWLDPKVIVLTGMLPQTLINQLIDYVKNTEQMQNINRTSAQLSASKIKFEDISIGAAIVPIYHFLQDDE
ncbi:ROK family protein [Avibacterium paragallinarum]|uniref:ROK family protein n=1 Tax=Avibacterium paragallinarum TaxID=728 RepID=UPI0021F7EF59|nr:ROK family protein [Avibacterium paragallinarum]UXN34178.1 ROK family protein [Avibacterium paragallinarum]